MFPPKLCECGCGEAAPIAPYDDNVYGIKAGQPRRFVRGHWSRTQRYGPLDRHGLTQYQRSKRSDAIWKLARDFIPMHPMTLQSFVDVVRAHWPEVTAWAVSRVCTSAGVREWIAEPEEVAQRRERRIERKIKSERRRAERELHRARPVTSDAARIAQEHEQTRGADWLLDRAFALATSMSYEKSADLLGPIWEGMVEAWDGGVRDETALIASAHESLKAHRKANSTYASRSIDSMREAWGYEPQQR